MSEQTTEIDRLRNALADELRPLIGAHADVAGNHLATSGRFALSASTPLDRKVIVQALLADWLRAAEANVVGSPRDHCESLADAVLRAVTSPGGTHDV